LTLADALGSGGFADVWRATDSDGRSCAVKVARRCDATTRQRFAREADILSRVGAPFAPALFCCGSAGDGRPFIAMELIEAPTLRQVLADTGAPLAAERVYELADGVLAALDAAHRQGVVHRDLTPNNVFVAADRVVLTDFGISVGATETNLTPTGVAVGTAEYMSPEQLAGGRNLDARTDLYAFGVVLYELLTLRVPFGGDFTSVRHGHSSRRPARPSKFAPVPRALEDYVLACLAKRPQDRPGTNAAEARRRLAAARTRPHALAAATPTSAPQRIRIAGAAQPAVVAVIDSDGSAEVIAQLVAANHGFVARQHRSRYVCVFTSLVASDPLAAGMTAARALCERSAARVALHVDELFLRRRADGTLNAYGRAIDAPESWLPEAWTEVTLTAAAEAMSLRDNLAAQPVVGRDAEHAAMATSAAKAFDGGGPVLLAISGGHGVGKSRLAAHAGALAREHGAEVIDVACRPPVDVGTSLLRAVVDDPSANAGARSRLELVRAIGDGLRARARVRPLAVVIDDAHWAHDSVLDAIEYATLPGESLPLWLVVTCRPTLLEARPALGQRARCAETVELHPLAEDEARALAAQQLLPAEYPPADLLNRVARWSGGIPRVIIDLVHALKRDGIVRQLPGTEGWYVATAELDRVVTSPATAWIAARVLDELPPDLATLARVCAVLGDEVRVSELGWMLDELDRAGVADTDIDPWVGLEQLVLHGIAVRAGDGRYAFSRGALRVAIYELLAEQSRRQLHECALQYWRARGGNLGAVARHARAGGALALAAESFLMLGDEARHEHAHCRADQFYTDALALLVDDAVQQRARAYHGRGAVRYRIDRAAEAVSDLDRAAELATTAGAGRLAASAALERATALDWAGDYAASAEALAAAADDVAALNDAALNARLEVGRGRTLVRQHAFAEAVDVLQRGATVAAAAGELEAEIIALLMLGPALVISDRLDEAEACYAEALKRCRQSADPFHLCAAYSNRLVLWMARMDHRAAVSDLRRAMQLAREIGHSLPEIAATVNLAELLFIGGDDSESLELATRARALRRRFVAQDFCFDGLLLARIHAARGEYAEAQRYVDEIGADAAGEQYTDSERTLLRAVRLTLSGAEPAQWAALHEPAELPVPQRMELRYWRARAARSRGDRAAVHDILAGAMREQCADTTWMRRLELVADSVAGAHAPGVAAPAVH